MKKTLSVAVLLCMMTMLITALGTVTSFAALASDELDISSCTVTGTDKDGGGLYRGSHRRRCKSVGRFGACEYFALLFSEWIPVLQQAGA